MGNYLLPPVAGWAEWQAIFTDVALWRPAVARVWQEDETLRGLSGRRAPGRVESGYPGTCAVFIVDGSAVIKFFPPMVARDFDRELAVYRLLHGRVPSIPALLSHGVLRDHIEWPYLVTSYLAGVAWRDVRQNLPGEQAEAILRVLGGVARATHDLPLPATGGWPAKSAWGDFVAARLLQLGADLRSRTSLPEGIIATIERLAGETHWYEADASLLHADLTEDHLLLVERSGRWSLAGLIDWADAEVGDPMYDWVALWFSICRRDAGFFRAFLEGYGSKVVIDAPLLERFTAFTFLHRFGANILNETLTPGEQRAITDLGELQRILFGGLAP